MSAVAEIFFLFAIWNWKAYSLKIPKM